MPSWEYYAEAAEEAIPAYKVETARSGRSKCTVCKKNSGKAVIADRAASEMSTAIVASVARSSSRAKKKSSSSAVVKQNDTSVISENEIRVGSLDEFAGSYGRWHHLECWRVPKKVQNGLTNPSDEEVSLRDLLSMVSWSNCDIYHLCVSQPAYSNALHLCINVGRGLAHWASGIG